ncbi:hypothetical protein QVD99_006385 [Batrachochytrium dendrobatidis]|nr:hypothetical protein O5D80_003271 [Batrachochytrium dendrobatidis]KAK5667177.1 hypothetical protein QVD99_006385 [Batrachochytrium dendrobatidis]
MKVDAYESSFILKDENIQLKKQLREKEDAAKRLATKVQKLTQDLSHQRTTGVLQKYSGPREPDISRRDARDTQELVNELRKQVEYLGKNNSTLKTKLGFFKTLHEAETRKRTPYDHIPPRVVTSSRTPAGKGIRHGTTPTQNYEELTLELQQQQQLIGALRGKLAETDRELKISKESVDQIQTDHAKKQHQDDIDRMALQFEINEQNKHIAGIKEKYDSLDEAHRLLTASHNELANVSEDLSKKLQAERQKADHLEHTLQNSAIQHQAESELLSIIEDLRKEKCLVEEELQKVLKIQFNTNRSQEYQQEILKLKRQLADYGVQVQGLLDDKVGLNKNVEDLNAKLEQLKKDKIDSDASLYNAQHEIESLKEQLKLFSRNGEISLNDIEEALTMVRLKRERGLTLDFLIQLDTAAKDTKALQLLRVQFADCAQELEKSTKLLMIQESINRDLKVELAQFQKQFTCLKNEYELRLEEDSQLLDLRGQRIAALESQIKDIVYGVAKLPPGIDFPKQDDVSSFDSLVQGQTAIEISIDTGLFSKEGQQHLLQTLPVLQNVGDSITMFVAVDFFEFETEFSGLGLSWKPRFNHTMRFNINADDYLLSYLQTRRVTLKLYYTNATDFFLLGLCQVNLKEFLDVEACTKRKYYADIMAADKNTIIGKLDFTVQMLVPMTLAVRAFKERTVALNLLKINDSTVKWDTHKSREKLNELVITLKSGEFLKTGPTTGEPKIYGVIFFGFHTPVFTTPTVCGTHIPTFNLVHTIPLIMSSDLDRYLRTEKCEIVFCDEDYDIFYGKATIYLDPLSRGEAIELVSELQSERGSSCGTISLSMKWKDEYFIDATPIVSLYEFQRKVDEPQLASSIVMGEPDEKQACQSDQSSLPPLPVVALEKINDMPLSDQDRKLIPHTSSIHVKVHSFEMDLDNPAVKTYFSNITQVFVSFDFLGYPLEDMETKSVVLGDSSIVSFDYSKDFLLDATSHSKHRHGLIELLKSANRAKDSAIKSPEIAFTIVQEPSDVQNGNENQECVDVGFCTLGWDFLVQSSASNKNGPIEVKLAAVDSSGLLNLGNLLVSIHISEDVFQEAEVGA